MSEEDGRPSAKIGIDHADPFVGGKLLSEALGTDDPRFLLGTLDSLGMIVQDGKQVDQEKLNYALSMVLGIKPRDQVETMLGVQMAAVHLATIKAAAFLGSATNRENIEVSEKSLNRLARTYVAQMEGLKRYRSKGEQRVYVERVTVNEGGQAIVGPVSHGGRDGGGEQNGK